LAGLDVPDVEPRFGRCDEDPAIGPEIPLPEIRLGRSVGPLLLGRAPVGHEPFRFLAGKAIEGDDVAVAQREVEQTGVGPEPHAYHLPQAPGTVSVGYDVELASRLDFDAVELRVVGASMRGRGNDDPAVRGERRVADLVEELPPDRKSARGLEHRDDAV